MNAKSIGIVGGTGPQGKGLAYRFAKAGHAVTLGSRDAGRSKAAMEALAPRLPSTARIASTDNQAAAARSEVVVIAIPYEPDGYRSSLLDLKESLVDKIVVTCANPLGFDKRGPYGLSMPEGSAAELTAELLPESDVVAAFHHLSAVRLLGEDDWLHDEDVLVCGDNTEHKLAVQELAATITGDLGIDAGTLRMARYLEPLTAVLISINKKYKTHSGVKVSGIPRHATQ